MLRLPRPVFSRLERFSLYNSPCPVYDSGCVIDPYVTADDPVAHSPVASVVRETQTVRTLGKPYAHDNECLILIDIDADATGLGWLSAPDDDPRDGLVVRILHVDPGVNAGDEIAVGDSLGRLVRPSFFAPWVPNHVHVGFRAADANHHRARGSLPVSPDVTVSLLDWDGVGTVVGTTETFVVPDTPTRTNAAVSPDGFVGLTNDEGIVLDDGLAHYGFGGALLPVEDGQSLSLLDKRVDRAANRDVPWTGFDVLIDDVRITGLSLFASRVDFGSKLICPGHGFATGDEVSVEIRPSTDPTRLDWRRQKCHETVLLILSGATARHLHSVAPSSNTSTMKGLASAENILQSPVSFSVHEIRHASVCRRFGARCSYCPRAAMTDNHASGYEVGLGHPLVGASPDGTFEDPKFELTFVGGVPVTNEPVPYFVTRGGDREMLDDLLDDHTSIERFEPISGGPEGRHYRCE